MKIVKLKIKNMFGISAYEQDGKSTELSGKNGTGKTSVLDAIKYALTNKSDREYIIKNGETEGEIYIETDTGLTIDRKVRTGMSDYKSVKQGNETIGSPEAFLKTIFTTLQLNPMEFISMDKKRQNAIILDLIKFDWDISTIQEWFGEIVPDVNYDQNILAVLNDIQAENGYYYQHRQDINRDIRAKKAIVADIGESLPVDYDGSKWEKMNIGDLYMEIEKIRKENAEIEKAKNVIDSHDQKLRGFEADKEVKLAALDREMTAEETNISTELASLEERIKSLKDKKAGLAKEKENRASVIESEYKASIAKFEGDVEKYADLAKKELTPLDEKLARANEVEKMKSHVGEWNRMLSIQDEIEDLEAASKKLTEKIEKARTLPGEILAKSELPVPNMSIGKDNIVLIDGKPISNLSEGEKLDLAVDISIQNPGGLQIILIDGVEKLSTANREQLYKRCKEKNIQYIATKTTDADELTVVEI